MQCAVIIDSPDSDSPTVHGPFRSWARAASFADRFNAAAERAESPYGPDMPTAYPIVIRPAKVREALKAWSVGRA